MHFLSRLFSGKGSQATEDIDSVSSLRVHAAIDESAGGSSRSDASLLTIAQAGVKLFELAPQLAETAANIESSAGSQAKTAAEIAVATARMAESLEAAVGSLSCSSGDAVHALDEVRKWADTMKLLSINASVEAARAGEAGRTFKVVAEHVQSMAQNAGATTKDVMKALSAMETDISSVKKALGEKDSKGKASSAGSDSVHGINRSMGAMTGIAEAQNSESHKIRQMGERTRALSEELILAIGRLRFNVHESCRDAVSSLAASEELLSLRKERVEPFLQSAFKLYPSFELFYVTDAEGRQFTRNLSPEGGPSSGKDAVGKDWSKRPWFQHALSSAEPYVSDLYLSVATDSFCFTVSMSLRDEDGTPLGVLGADVSFKRLLER